MFIAAEWNDVLGAFSADGVFLNMYAAIPSEMLLD